MEIHSLVKSIVKEYGTRNPFEIIRAKKVLLLFVPLVDIRGFYQYFQRNHLIYIDESLSEHEKLFVCAHELGHMLMHASDNAVFMDTRTYFNTNKQEIEADTFAADLLISDKEVYEHSDLTTEQLSRLLGYEQSLIELRLKSYREL